MSRIQSSSVYNSTGSRKGESYSSHLLNALGYVPVVGSIIGISRIADAVLTRSEHANREDEWGLKRMIRCIARGSIETLGAGGIFIPIDITSIIYQLFRSLKREDLNKNLNELVPQGELVSQEEDSKPWDDKRIIDNLVNQGFKAPEFKGGNGSCLFYSILPHIKAEDLSQAKSEFPDLFEKFPNWQSENLAVHSDEAYRYAVALRNLAMAREEVFFKSVKDTPFDKLTEDEKKWINEFYKDMLQEVGEMSNLDEVRKLANTTDDQEKFNHFKQNFKAYKENTARPNNNSGTSEAIALSYATGLSLKMFGGDRTTLERTELDQEGNLLPYYERHVPGSRSTIYVFQVGGGGSYRFIGKT